MKKALVVVLFLAALIDAVLGVGVLLAPASLMQSFQITTMTPEVSYLAAIVGWFCLIVAASAALAGYWVKEGRPEGKALSIALGLFWVGIGVHLAFAFGRPQHLGLDAL